MDSGGMSPAALAPSQAFRAPGTGPWPPGTGLRPPVPVRSTARGALPRPPAQAGGGSRPPAMPELEVLARTLWGEARGEPVRGLEAVAAVVVNRLAAAKAGRSRCWGRSIREVCLAPGQFLCWARTDPNRRLLLAVDASDPVFATCQRIARRALAGTLADRTSGATHYHADSVFPSWAVGHLPCAEIGRHLFYKLPVDATPHER